jgi:hypothetical protein
MIQTVGRVPTAGGLPRCHPAPARPTSAGPGRTHPARSPRSAQPAINRSDRTLSASHAGRPAPTVHTDSGRTRRPAAVTHAGCAGRPGRMAATPGRARVAPNSAGRCHAGREASPASTRGCRSVPTAPPRAVVCRTTGVPSRGGFRCGRRPARSRIVAGTGSRVRPTSGAARSSGARPLSRRPGIAAGRSRLISSPIRRHPASRHRPRPPVPAQREVRCGRRSAGRDTSPGARTAPGSRRRVRRGLARVSRTSPAVRPRPTAGSRAGRTGTSRTNGRMLRWASRPARVSR